MNIAGLQKLTLSDFPEKTACIVFTGGCNFRCPFCHNSSLICCSNKSFISENEFFNFLNNRKSILEGVCISGGEPTLQSDLKDFVKKIKQLNFSVKLDTNGYNPDVLIDLCENKLVDYVAMDIKNSAEKYSLTTGMENILFDKIKRSAEYLMQGDTDFEFRTTIVDNFHSEEDFYKIGLWLKGNEKYFLQKFKDNENVLKKELRSPTNEDLDKYLKILQNYIPNTKIR